MSFHVNIPVQCTPYVFELTLKACAICNDQYGLFFFLLRSAYLIRAQF